MLALSQAVAGSGSCLVIAFAAVWVAAHRPGRKQAASERGNLAALLARRIAALAQRAPEGSQFGVHLCLGDMNHRALGRLSDA